MKRPFFRQTEEGGKLCFPCSPKKVRNAWSQVIPFLKKCDALDPFLETCSHLERTSLLRRDGNGGRSNKIYGEAIWWSFFSQEFCRRSETSSFYISFTFVSLFEFFQSAGKFFGRVDAPLMQQLIRSDESSSTGVYNKWVHIEYCKLENGSCSFKVFEAIFYLVSKVIQNYFGFELWWRKTCLKHNLVTCISPCFALAVLWNLCICFRCGVIVTKINLKPRYNCYCIFADVFHRSRFFIRYINNSLQLARKYAGIFVRGHDLFSESKARGKLWATTFRATLNFRKFKVSLNPMYRIF